MINARVEMEDALESLEFWHARSRRLAWYRVGARREAKLMAARWEQRIRDAVLSQRGLSLGTRAGAVWSIARMRARRFHLRRFLVAASVFAVAVLSVPLLLAIVLLQQIF